MADHRSRNEDSRKRLAAVAARVASGDDTLHDVGTWPPSVVLAHLAFWDRLVLVRWQRAARDGTSIPIGLTEGIAPMLNEATEPDWHALDAADAARLAVAAAEACDAAVEHLTADQLAALDAAGQMRLAERNHHRNNHLDELLGVAATGH